MQSNMIAYTLLLLLLTPHVFFHTGAIGVNYGRLGNNLPSASRVVELIRSLNINVDRVKIFDADQDVLSAFANSGFRMTVAVSIDQVSKFASIAQEADNWVKSNIKPWSNIDVIVVGNEQLSDSLVPAMRNVKSALDSNGLGNIKVTTPLKYDVIGKSDPPSEGSFNTDLSSLLQFLSDTGSFFMINIYPYFSWRDNKGSISLDYALFQGEVNVDNKRYTSLLDAQTDAVYSALERAGYGHLNVQIGETGWPSDGGDGASKDNARNYNTRLVRKINGNNGTPKRPSDPITTYIFALFNENQKGGEEIEKHWGLLNPDGSPVYSLN